MLIAQWIVAGLLALAFLASGISKLAQPREALVKRGMGWAMDVSAPAVNLIGAIEVVGAVGLILPLATGIAPVLSPLAAVGLAIVMVAAVVVHVRRAEAPWAAVALGVLAVVAAVLGFIAL
jgi:uncharacterized membrane protein